MGIANNSQTSHQQHQYTPEEIPEYPWQADELNGEKMNLESGRLSPEFINFGLALLIAAVRYPSVFWLVNKSFGLLFSFHLVANTLQSLLAYSAFTVLYKLHIYGPSRVLKIYPTRLSLTVDQTVGLFLSYFIILTISSSAVYLYGWTKYKEWKGRKFQERSHVMALTISKSFCCAGYLSHLLSFMVFISLSATGIPLIYDLAIVYAGSYDMTALIGGGAILIHLLSWLIMWIFFTLKSRWSFASTINQQPNLIRNSLRGAGEKGDPPLLVVDRGQTYQIRELGSKKAILSMAQRNHINPLSPDASGEEVYWLKPRPPLPRSQDDHVDSSGTKKAMEEKKTLSWLRRKKNKDGQGKTGGKKEERAISEDGEEDYSTLRGMIQREPNETNMVSPLTFL